MMMEKISTRPPPTKTSTIWSHKYLQWMNNNKGEIELRLSFWLCKEGKKLIWHFFFPSFPSSFLLFLFWLFLCENGRWALFVVGNTFFLYFYIVLVFECCGKKGERREWDGRMDVRDDSIYNAHDLVVVIYECQWFDITPNWRRGAR